MRTPRSEQTCVCGHLASDHVTDKGVGRCWAATGWEPVANGLSYFVCDCREFCADVEEAA